MKKKVLGLVHNISLRKKILIVFIFVVFTPVLLTGLLLTIKMQEMALDSAIAISTNNVDRVMKRINGVFDTAVTISMKFAGSSELENIIVNEYQSDWDLINTYFNYKQFDEVKALYNEIEDVRFYVYNKVMIDNWRFMKITKEIEDQSWYKKAIELNGKIYWGYFDIGNQIYDNPSICLVRQIRSVNGKNLGILVVKTKRSLMNSILSQEAFRTFVLNEDDMIISSSIDAFVGNDMHVIGPLNISNMEWGNTTIVSDNQKSHVVWKETQFPSSAQKLSIVSMFPEGQILDKTNRINLMGFSIIGVTLIVSTMVVFLVSSVLSNRIRVISKDMHKVACGDFDYTPSITGSDEAGKLAQDLHHMVNSIKRLFAENQDATQQRNILLMKQKEIKYKMLVSQINPHFLFNTLEAIRMEASYNGQHDIAKVVKLLGRIMRRSLSTSNDNITLNDEFDTVKNYLEIQKFRYRDKVNYEVDDIPKGVERLRIIPFIVQPIVENAFIHGLEKKVESGTIHISTYQENNVLSIIIQDDGVGMTDEEVTSLQLRIDNVEENGSDHIGLSNIHQRIKLAYGEQYGLSIRSSIGKGTTVEIQVPERG